MSARRPRRAPPHLGTPAPPHSWEIAGAASIILAVAIAYRPSLRGAFILDDGLLLTTNRLVQAPDGLYRFWFTRQAVDYWPVFNSALWIEWRLWGTDPTGYHVTNIALHAAACLLLWAVLRRLAIPGAFLAALLFAVHPVNVETVAWISQLKSLLAMVFYLLSILFYLRSEPAAVEAARGGRPVTDRWYWLSLATFAVAMLSKGSVAMLPGVLLLLVWWRRPLTGRDLVRVLPFAVVAAALVLVTISFQARFMADIAPIGPLERMLRAGAIVWFYLGTALFPVNLSFIYPQWEVHNAELRWWLPLLAAVAVTALFWLYRRTWARPLWLAWAYVGIALLPAMGFTDVTFMEHSPVADHYQHAALIGVVSLSAAGWAVWRRSARGPARWGIEALAVAAVGACMVLSWNQSSLYVDGTTLFRDTLAKNPDSAFAHNALAIVLADGGQTQEAIAHWEAALRIKPDYPDAQYNIGRTLFDSGQNEESIVHFRAALQLRPANAKYHYNLGTALARTDRRNDAIRHLEEAVRIDPGDPHAYNNLANLLLDANRRSEASALYRQALQLDPDFAEARLNLGAALYAAGRRDEAIEQWTSALRVRPDYAEAHNALGAALTEAGELREAIEHLREAVRLRPEDPIARANLQEATALAASRSGNP